MIQTQFVRFLQMCGLVLLQVLICNHIHLFGVATPQVYLALLLYFSANSSRISILLWSFAIGLVVDIFDNTPGMAAASMTFVGFILPSLLRSIQTKDRTEDTRITLSEMGLQRFLAYVLILSLIHCFLYFMLEAFTFQLSLITILSIIGSTLLTALFVLLLELCRS